MHAAALLGTGNVDYVPPLLPLLHVLHSTQVASRVRGAVWGGCESGGGARGHERLAKCHPRMPGSGSAHKEGASSMREHAPAARLQQRPLVVGFPLLQGVAKAAPPTCTASRVTMAVPSTLVDTVSTQLDVLPDMSDTSVRETAAGAEHGEGWGDGRKWQLNSAGQ